MQDKLYKKQHGIATGPMVVFYGCRHEEEELLYKDEWKTLGRHAATELVGLGCLRRRACLPSSLERSSARAQDAHSASDVKYVN